MESATLADVRSTGQGILLDAGPLFGSSRCPADSLAYTLSTRGNPGPAPSSRETGEGLVWSFGWRKRGGAIGPGDAAPREVRPSPAFGLSSWISAAKQSDGQGLGALKCVPLTSR